MSPSNAGLTFRDITALFGIDADWCALAEASLSVEAADLPLHLVNTFAMHINAHCYPIYSVKGPLIS